MTYKFSTIAAAVAFATALGTVPVVAETTGGATLAGGDNGAAAAKADANAKAQTPLPGDASKGSAAATPASGQSTEHSEGTIGRRRTSDTRTRLPA